MKKLLLTLALLLLPTLSFAQSFQSFSAKPTFPNKDLPFQFTVEAKPNSTDTESLTIYNTSNKPTTFFLGGVDSGINDKKEVFFKLTTDKQADMGLWITAPKDPIIVAANGEKQVDFQINVPADAQQKDYLGGISVEAQNVGTVQKNGQNLSVNIRAVVRINLKVTNTPQPVEKIPTPPLLTPMEIYLSISILLFVIVCGYFAFKQITSKKKATHRKN